MNNNFPKILSNIPEGKDLFKVESHKKIASTISKIIEFQSDSIEKQIIGLEGEWGTGKSNIIKIIEEEISKKSCLKDKYVFFNYDTWTHQEDLTRKSILIELINSLKSRVNVFNSKYWIDKEKELYQKKISKNTKHFPRVKLYFISLVIGFIIIKILNETKKNSIDGKSYGFYEDSLDYILNYKPYIIFSKSIDWIYILKIIPYLFFAISIVSFIISFIIDIIENIKKSEKDKLKIRELIGRSFYWISGEKLESDSDETITEVEPSNLRFRNFLSEIDKELILNNKKLILTIDNTDRLTEVKLKSIWSTINIFFAENNNQENLKNIWLIVPYDYDKVINSFGNEIGLGLLEKTFAIVFKVPPPLNSNWEEFFKISFKKSFNEIEIDEIESELEILLKLYESFEVIITPRRIINFINQLATFYIQNTKIKLRYYGLFCLKKNYFFEGNINDNIINRSYLTNVAVLFIDDDDLELNLSKIIYGVESNDDAKESLLHNLIIKKLKKGEKFEEDVLNLSYFQTYFYKYFKQFVNQDLTPKTNFEIITNLLIIQEKNFNINMSSSLYKELWNVYARKIYVGQFFKFNSTLKGICTHCSYKEKIAILNNHINQLSKRELSDEISKDEAHITYYNFLSDFHKFNNEKNLVKTNDLKVEEYYVNFKTAINFVKQDKVLFPKLNIKLPENDFVNFIKYKEIINENAINVHLDNYNEILYLHNLYKYNFLNTVINDTFNKNRINDFNEIEVLFFYYKNLDNISLDKLPSKVYASLVDLIKNNESKNDISNAILLLILNYKSDEYLIIKEDIKEALLKLNNTDIILLLDIVKNLKNNENLISLYKIIYDINDNTVLNNFAIELINKNLIVIDNECFNWFLTNYTFYDSIFSRNSNFSFYDYLNKNYINHEININSIDINILDNSRKKMNLELINKSNLFLKEILNNESRFIQNNNSQNFKLFARILELGKEKEYLFNDNLTSSYCNFSLEMNVNSFVSDDILFLIKSKIKSEAIVEYLKLKNNYNVIINRKNSFMLAPEIFSFFKQINNMQKRRVLQEILTKHKFYTNELIDEIINLNDNQLLMLIKQNISNCPHQKVVNYAQERGLVEPNL
jgi:hypothetical protein